MSKSTKRRIRRWAKVAAIKVYGFAAAAVSNVRQRYNAYTINRYAAYRQKIDIP